VNCEEYIANYLSAHADGELTPEEEDAVVEHLGRGVDDGCAACRARLAEERLLKALIRRQASTVDTPRDLRARIRSALDQIDGARPSGARGATVARLRRPSTWIPLAAAAAIIVALLMRGLPALRQSEGPSTGGLSSITPQQAFDQAVEHFASFEHEFHPNVSSRSLAEIAKAYGVAEMPAEMWDFSRSGFSIAGGRIDRLPDGNPVTYTFYRNPHNDILCMRYKTADFAVPPDPIAEYEGHLLYQYKGYTLCVTVSQTGRYVCVLTTNVRPSQFMRDMELAR
jgi:anti-sigma factor RsiW